MRTDLVLITKISLVMQHQHHFFSVANLADFLQHWACFGCIFTTCRLLVSGFIFMTAAVYFFLHVLFSILTLFSAFTVLLLTKSHSRYQTSGQLAGPFYNISIYVVHLGF